MKYYMWGGGNLTVKDKIDDLNTKTTPLGLTITIIPNNGYVDSIAGYAYKIGKILFFNIRDIRPVNTAASTNWVHVGNISNWSSNEECFAHLLSQGLNSVELTVRIGGDGKIYLYTQSAMDGTKIFRGMTMTISTNY